MKVWHITGLFAVMVIGLILVSGCTTSTPPAQPAQTTNPTSIPNLTGTWVAQIDGALMTKSDIPGPWAKRTKEFETVTGQHVITRQQGRVLQGVFSSSQGKDEPFIGVIGMDNKAVYFADMDGIMDCQIVNNDLMTGVYRHVTQNETVAGVGTWTRVK